MNNYYFSDGSRLDFDASTFTFFESTGTIYNSTVNSPITTSSGDTIIVDYNNSVFNCKVNGSIIYTVHHSAANTSYSPRGTSWSSNTVGPLYDIDNRIQTDIGDILETFGIEAPEGETAKCSSCGEEGEIAISYKLFIERKLCKKCGIKALDKLFGIDININTEKVLYGKKEEA